MVGQNTSQIQLLVAQWSRCIIYKKKKTFQPQYSSIHLDSTSQSHSFLVLKIQSVMTHFQISCCLSFRKQPFHVAGAGPPSSAGVHVLWSSICPQFHPLRHPSHFQELMKQNVSAPRQEEIIHLRGTLAPGRRRPPLTLTWGRQKPPSQS